VASVIANVNRGKNSRLFKPQDFMPKYDEPVQQKEQTVDEMKSILMGMVKSTKGKTKNK